MTAITVDRNTVRQLLLAVQGLSKPPARPAEKQDVLDTIRRMGVLQIDTIHVVARSPYFVLWSRLGSYDPSWLDEHLAEGLLFEYWAHAACFIPIEDYPLYRYRMDRLNQRYYSGDWIEKHQTAVDVVLEKICADGPVRSADFERTDGQKGSWWNWKEEKQALEYLHTIGHLMIARREKFQRVYDLRERILPDWDTSPEISKEEAEDEFAVRAVRHLGIVPARWAHDYYRIPKLGIGKRMERLAESGRVLSIAVEGWKEPGYIHPENLSLLEQATGGELTPTVTTLLSPFDPIVWDRERARGLFNFDYTIECYTPEAKRLYGYFTLPILHEDALVGRLDAKAHRKEGIFAVRSIHLEPSVHPTVDLTQAVAGAIIRCADWHGTPQVVVERSAPDTFKTMLESALGERLTADTPSTVLSAEENLTDAE